MLRYQQNGCICRHLVAALIDVGYLDEMPPASLEAVVKYTAARVMPHFLPDEVEGNTLWLHPTVKRSRDVAELLQIIEATGSRKPELAAGGSRDLQSGHWAAPQQIIAWSSRSGTSCMWLL